MLQLLVGCTGSCGGLPGACVQLLLQGIMVLLEALELLLKPVHLLLGSQLGLAAQNSRYNTIGCQDSILVVQWKLLTSYWLPNACTGKPSYWQHPGLKKGQSLQSIQVNLLQGTKGGAGSMSTCSPAYQTQCAVPSAVAPVRLAPSATAALLLPAPALTSTAPAGAASQGLHAAPATHASLAPMPAVPPAVQLPAPARAAAAPPARLELVQQRPAGPP